MRLVFRKTNERPNERLSDIHLALGKRGIVFRNDMLQFIRKLPRVGFFIMFGRNGLAETDVYLARSCPDGSKLHGMMTTMYDHRNYGCLRPDRNDAAAHLETTDAVSTRKPAFAAPTNPFACLRGSHHAVNKGVGGASVASCDQFDIDFCTGFAGEGDMSIYIGTGEPIHMRPNCNEICC